MDPSNPRQPWLKRLWLASGMNIPMFLTMMKGGLPAAISASMLQSTSAATEFAQLGYLVTIVASLSLCIFPRATLVQLTITNGLFVCMAAAASLLSMYCADVGRRNNPYSPKTPYNPVAATISGIWLFVWIYLINLFRAHNPQLAFPVIMTIIFLSIVHGYGALYDLAQVLPLVKSLLKAFFTGFAISLATGLVVFPVTCRDVLQKTVTNYLETSKKLLIAQRAFLQAHEYVQPSKSDSSSESSEKTLHAKPGKPQKAPLEALSNAHGALFTKLAADVKGAKHEVTWAYLSTPELCQFSVLLRETILPIQGMTTLLEIFNRLYEATPVGRTDQWRPNPIQTAEVMRTLKEPYDAIVTMTNDAIEHVLLTMKYKKAPKTSPAPEVAAEEGTRGVAPGTAGFSEAFEAKINDFYSHHRLGDISQKFKDVLSEDSFLDCPSNLEDVCYKRNSQLNLILFMEFLLYSTSHAMLNLVQFVDKKKAEGVLEKKHFVYPTLRRLRKWIASVSSGNGNDEDELADASDTPTFQYRDGQKASKRDPDHRPARKFYQKIGIPLNTIWKHVGSKESGFAFRVACACLVCVLPAYFQGSFLFYIKNRLSWAVVMVVLCMTPTSGSSVISLLERIAGTAIGVVFALINWYIVDFKTAGILVFLWVLVSLQFYTLLRFPRLTTPTITSMLTQILIISYELQTRKLGAKGASSLQPALSTLSISGNRLVVIIGGLAVAFFFTLLPYPVTTRALVRKDLSEALYLLAQTYANSVSLVRMRLSGKFSQTQITEAQKKSAKELTAGLRAQKVIQTQIGFAKWEGNFAGVWPGDKYVALLKAIDEATSCLFVMSYASRVFSLPETKTGENCQWRKRIAQEMTNLRSRDVAGLLVVLSAALREGRSLPVAIDTVRPLPGFRIADLKEMEEEVEEGKENGGIKTRLIAAWAVMQVAAVVMTVELEKIKNEVEELVGTVEFCAMIKEEEEEGLLHAS